MKKALTILTLMALGVSTAFGGVFLYETHIEDTLDFAGENVAKVMELEFTTDQPSIVSITYGWCRGYFGSMGDGTNWLTCNGDSLGMSTVRNQSTSTYMTELESGTYTLGLVSKFYYGSQAFVINPRLQVLVLYNDAPSVTETPPQTTPTENPSIISCGPSVTVPGCSEVVDVSGRKVDCEINGDRIMVNSLSSGTYFATGTNGRTTKIVKLK
ncbi:MAG: hypothetical protein U9Q76_01200 [candidate division WOR-3 bacterium]|nr:hypothetical protein [candidate division WOR-3 bacterium]